MPKNGAMLFESFNDILVTFNGVDAEVLAAEQDSYKASVATGYSHVPLDLSFVVNGDLVLSDDLAVENFSFLGFSLLVSAELVGRLAFKYPICADHATGFSLTLLVIDGDTPGNVRIDYRTVNVGDHPAAHT